MSIEKMVFINNLIILIVELTFFILKSLGYIEVSWWFMIIPIIFMSSIKEEYKKDARRY